MTHPEPSDLGLTAPAASRIYDFSLGGKDNYGADREIAIEAFGAFPAARLLPRENRKFMRRAIRFMLEAGVRQFIDLGCGLPGKGNVHEVVHGTDPAGRVVYVDTDPVAVVHYQALLHSVPTATAVRGDVRKPGEVLADPEVAALIDLGRPVGILMTAVLDLVRDEEDPEAAVAGFRDVMAPGSHLAVCDFAEEGLTDADRAARDRMVAESGVVVTFRPRSRLASFFDGLELLAPGLVPAPDWRPDRPHEPATGWLLAGIGRRL
ncbi:SAM-dependent methyltransferase [Actinomadura rubrisoli]|uniref:SAM-dependent methyltransferase n=1 Tax=Actinomadura rubrisoli TaxID=2530368 RepID=A0A4R5BMR5_9ACTN|nr:SAM-dependent methyltransferase [Actinomadura rubrisoli]TDD86410.1 SAM-dependent methyltransferase [Actinomadura rubrisoli]